jgi:hypothetical protein
MPRTRWRSAIDGRQPVSTDRTRVIGFDLPIVVGSAASNDPVQRLRATRVVAAGARDAADCALLLAMIGLTAADGLAHPVD